MEKIAVACPPYISPKSSFPFPALLLKEYAANADKIKPAGTWIKGKAGHYTLPIYFDDGVSGTGRDVWVQWRGTSKFGLGFFKKEGEENSPQMEETDTGVKFKDEEKKEKKEKKKEKKRQPSANMSVDLDSSPQARQMDAVTNAIVRAIMVKQGPILREVLCPGSNSTLPLVVRRLARPPAGSSRNIIRVNAYPGSVQLEDKEGERLAMKDYLDQEGSYIFNTQWNLDATYTNGVISVGPALHAKIIKQAEAVNKQPVAVRKEEEVDESEDMADEDKIFKDLSKTQKEAAKAKKEADKVKKESGKKKRKYKEEEQEKEEM